MHYRNQPHVCSLNQKCTVPSKRILQYTLLHTVFIPRRINNDMQSLYFIYGINNATKSYNCLPKPYLTWKCLVFNILFCEKLVSLCVKEIISCQFIVYMHWFYLSMVYILNQKVVTVYYVGLIAIWKVYYILTEMKQDDILLKLVYLIFHTWKWN